MKRKTTAQFVAEANEIHEGEYDYSLVEYIGSDSKVKIICRVHGIFEQTPSRHLNGRGCQRCGGSALLNTDEFICKAVKIHGNRYDYSLVEYINSKSKVKIICPDHGVFEQVPSNHLTGQRCDRCGGTATLNTTIFIERSAIKHNHKYDYSLVEYINNSSKVKIVCPEHGIFEQVPATHIKGSGCFLCRNVAIGDKLRSDSESFVSKAAVIHNNIYDYSKVVYHKAVSKVEIICRIHGSFFQTPNAHLAGKGCNCCYEKSKGEEYTFDYLTKMNIEFERQSRFSDCKSKICLPFDFTIHTKSGFILIEIDGTYHRKSIPLFGGEAAFERRKENDKIKDEWAASNGIPLYRINYDSPRTLSEIGMALERIISLHN